MPAANPNRDPADIAVAADLGARIRARRTKLGLSQEQLAEAAGLHWSFISQLERGEHGIRLINLLKICAGLDIDIGLFLKGMRLTD